VNTIDKLLIERTGEPSLYWLNRIGTLIGKHSKAIRGTKGLESTEVHKWVAELGREVSRRVRLRSAPTQDENLGVSLVLGLILSLFGIRIVRAKCYDPRRPVRVRRQVLNKSLLRYQTALLEVLVDESQDAKYFPKQEWDSPNSPTARYEPDEMELKRQAYGKKHSRKRKK
jgi:hypothetical protein